MHIGVKFGNLSHLSSVGKYLKMESIFLLLGLKTWCIRTEREDTRSKRRKTLKWLQGKYLNVLD